MANKVLGIEISQNITRVVEMDFKVKNPKIYNMFYFATPPDMIQDGGVEANSLFGAMLHSKMKELHITTNKVIFVLNSARIASREVEIPFVKENRVKDLLMANASDYFPVDLNQYELVHEIIGKVEDGEEKKLRLSVIAVPMEIIRSYELLTRSCGMTLAGLDYTGNAIKQLMIREIPGEIKATIKVDESVAILTIMEGNEIKLQRMLNYGIGEAVEVVQDSELFGEYLSFEDAMDVVRRRTVVNMRFEDTGTTEENYEPGNDLDSEKLATLKSQVTYNLQTLIGSFARVLDYYQSRNTEKTIDKIFLVGMGADFSGLSKLMSNELNYKVIALQQFEGLALHKGINLSTVKLPEFFTCIGSTIKPLPIYVPDKRGKSSAKKGDEEVAQKGESLTGALVIMGIFVAAALCLGGFSVYSTLQEKTRNIMLQNQVAEVEYAQAICDEYMAAKSKYDWITNLDENTKSHNNNLVSFIEEFEKKMPSQTQVLAFVAEKEGVAFTIKVKTKEAVADVIENLRTFNTITVGTVDAITEEEDQNGNVVVTFSVACKYVAEVPSTEATTENAQQETSTEASTEESTEAATENIEE